VTESEYPNCHCGKPARLVVEGVSLCEEHRNGWLVEERIARVMAALDRFLDRVSDDDWEAHLRKMALTAIGAM